MGCGPVDLSSYHQTKIGGQNTESRAGKCLQHEARKLLVTGCTEDVNCEIRHYSMFEMLDTQCGIIFQFNCGLDFLFGLPNFLAGRFWNFKGKLIRPIIMCDIFFSFRLIMEIWCENSEISYPHGLNFWLHFEGNNPTCKSCSSSVHGTFWEHFSW